MWHIAGHCAGSSVGGALLLCPDWDHVQRKLGLERLVGLIPESINDSDPERINQERALMEAALAETRGRISGPEGAARRLGVPRTTLESKIKNLGIDKYRYRGGAGRLHIEFGDLFKNVIVAAESRPTEDIEDADSNRNVLNGHSQYVMPHAARSRSREACIYIHKSQQIDPFSCRQRVSFIRDCHTCLETTRAD